MSEYPPIPPNCPYFQDGKFVVPDGGHSKNAVWIVALSTANPDGWRPIIAAVFRCAWLDEATRICAKYPASSFEIFNNPVDYRAQLQAHENAQDWAEWGKN